MEILNLIECTEILDIKEVSINEKENYQRHLLHNGSVDKQVLDYIIYNTKVSFEEIRKIFDFDFSRAEKNETIIIINKTALWKLDV